MEEAGVGTPVLWAGRESVSSSTTTLWSTATFPQVGLRVPRSSTCCLYGRARPSPLGTRGGQRGDEKLYQSYGVLKQTGRWKLF